MSCNNAMMKSGPVPQSGLKMCRTAFISMGLKHCNTPTHYRLVPSSGCTDWFESISSKNAIVLNFK